MTQQFHEQHFKKKGGLGEGRDGPLAILKSAVVPGVVVYLTFTLIYGGIITPVSYTHLTLPTNREV